MSKILFVINTDLSIKRSIRPVLEKVLSFIPKTDRPVYLLDVTTTGNTVANIVNMQEELSTERIPFMYLTSPKYIKVEDNIRDVVIITDWKRMNRSIYYDLLGKQINPFRVRFYLIGPKGENEKVMETQ